jgi:hypothetical protein
MGLENGICIFVFWKMVRLLFRQRMSNDVDIGGEEELKDGTASRRDQHCYSVTFVPVVDVIDCRCRCDV